MFTLNNTNATASDTNTLLLNRTNQTGTNLKLGIYDSKNGKFALINTNGYLVNGVALNNTHVGAAATSHAHGNITNAGAIGTTATLPIITTTSGVLTTGSFGTGAGTFCQGNDTRLSDARTPANHALINTTNHTVSGLTTGHFLKATGATTYAFGAHGLTASDVGAAASTHNHGTGTDNQLVRWDGTTGSLQNSGITVADTTI